MRCNMQQIARVGSSSTQRASARGCCVGPHDLQAAERNARSGPLCKYTALADELELVQSRVNVISPNHSHGPISCTAIYDK